MVSTDLLKKPQHAGCLLLGELLFTLFLNGVVEKLMKRLPMLC